MEVYQEQYIGILMEYLKMVIHQILTKIVKYMNMNHYRFIVIDNKEIYNDLLKKLGGNDEIR